MNDPAMDLRKWWWRVLDEARGRSMVLAAALEMAIPAMGTDGTVMLDYAEDGLHVRLAMERSSEVAEIIGAVTGREVRVLYGYKGPSGYVMEVA